jgi:hypothetical protein
MYLVNKKKLLVQFYVINSETSYCNLFVNHIFDEKENDNCGTYEKELLSIEKRQICSHLEESYGYGQMLRNFIFSSFFNWIFSRKRTKEPEMLTVSITGQGLPPTKVSLMFVQTRNTMAVKY